MDAFFDSSWCGVQLFKMLSRPSAVSSHRLKPPGRFVPPSDKSDLAEAVLARQHSAVAPRGLQPVDVWNLCGGRWMLMASPLF